MLQFIAGLTGLKRADGATGMQEVIIRERGDVIHLALTDYGGATLTPEQARELAAMLIRMADRLEPPDGS